MNMVKQIDLGNLQQLIEEGQQAGALKKQLQEQVGKVQRAQQQLTDELQSLSALLQEGKKAKGKRGEKQGAQAKEERPKPGSAPEQLCKVMSSEKPLQVEEIARKTRLSEGTVKQYLHKFDCFYSAGRGKGYLFTPSSSPAPAAGATGMRLTPKRSQAAKAKKKTTKKRKKS